MRFHVFTLFPAWFDWLREARPLVNARAADAFDLVCHDYRAHTPLRAGHVDDAPYGGGPGMVIRVDVVAAALEGAFDVPAERVREERRVCVMSPRGRPFDDGVARELAAEEEVVLLCGRYEGFDERVHEHLASDVLSIGPYVLAGGEIPAMAVVEAVARRLPGALGNAESLEHESFSEGLGGGTEFPHYTRPAEFRGWAVPQVLLSGHHGEVERWRRTQVGPPPARRGEPGGPLVRSVDHLVLTVADVDRTVEFYARALGLERVDFGKGRVAVAWHGGKLNLHPATGRPIRPRATAPTAGSADVCFLATRSLAEVVAHLEAAGVEIEAGPVEREGGAGRLASVYVRDPDGNLVEISQVVGPADGGD